ncbi:hypothetical protein Y032_0725g1861 [Ancylostoma ceylanicum]|uniref:Uncharacterized protein n=1 Tax=Ancylostoma ceylanicum TaxID=53326 RepID=A0A016WEP4_9BILA|nr:hypothetical protein Y032_0725g1861 [Ancylostoma ceylanicum]
MGLEVLLILALSLSATAHVSSKLGDFLDIVRQRGNGNEIAQCPCVIHKESGKCIVYNSRYQATNIEEAMFTFHDLTSPLEAELDMVSFSCKTPQCQQCFSLLYYHLVDNGIVEKDFRPVTQLLPRRAVRPSLCPRYRFLKDVNIPPLPELVPPHVQTMIVNGLQNAGKPIPQGIAMRPWPGRFDQFGPQQQQQQQEQQQQRQQQQQRIMTPPQQNGGQGPSAGWVWNPLTKRWQFLSPSTFGDGAERYLVRTVLLEKTDGFGDCRIAARLGGACSRNMVEWVSPRHRSRDATKPYTQFVYLFATRDTNATSPIAVPSSGAPQTLVNQHLSPWNGHDGRYTIPYGRQKSTWQHQGQQLQPAQSLGDDGFVPSPTSFGGYGKRKKRAAKQSIVGSRFIIGCSNRGESDDNLLALCGSCWAWRELPEDYFPRLLNELSCKEDDFCLSGALSSSRYAVLPDAVSDASPHDTYRMG